MIRPIWVLLCATAVLFTAGCGGGGGGHSSSPGFAGRFVGATTTTPVGAAVSHTTPVAQNGALELRITSGGSISGFWIDSTSSTSSNATGTISSAGAANITANGTIYTGALTLHGSTLSGTLTDATGGTTPLSLTMIPGNANKFAGLVGGTIADSDADVGTVEMINDTSGNVLAGLSVDSTKHTTGTLTGSITSAGAVNITSSNSNWTVTGTLSFTTGNNITGTLNLSGGGTSTVSFKDV